MVGPLDRAARQAAFNAERDATDNWGGLRLPSAMAREKYGLTLSDADKRVLAASPPKKTFVRGGVRRVDGDIWHVSRPDHPPLRFEVEPQGDHPSALAWKTHHIYHNSIDAVNEFLYTLNPNQMIIISVKGEIGPQYPGDVDRVGRGHLAILGRSYVDSALRPSGQEEMKKGLSWFFPDSIEHFTVWTRRDGQ